MKARKEAFEAAIPIETKDRCTDIIEKMRTIETILSEKRETISTAISSIWHAFKGNEAARRILFGENDYTDVQFEEKSRFLAMYEYICEDRANTIKQSYQNQALALLSSLNSSNSSWKSYIEEVNRQVSEINSELRQINFISNIRRIEIRSMRRKDSLLDRMSMLPSLEEDARKGGYDFFADQGNKFYRFMDDLDEALMDRKEPTLKAIDAISLQMRIDEGQNTGEWFGTFEPKGSTGTKVFAKNFFYVAILKSLIRKYERANWKARLPLLFDEVGQLTNDYMEQFLIKAKESGFNCMTAQPSTSWNVDLATYDQEYQMTPSEKNPDFVTITEMFKKRNTFVPQE